jgi:hypothetical protein
MVGGAGSHPAGGQIRGGQQLPLLSRRITRRRAGRRARGQTLVEFALVFPVFLLLTFALIEFAFVFSAMLGISYATRDAALLAAEAGSNAGADCVVLEKIEQDVTAPGSPTKITDVYIYRADRNGVEVAGVSNHWTRTGSTDCDGTAIPYTRQTNGYPEGMDPLTNTPYRCNWIDGCDGRPLDIVGVRIVYVHAWVTPLAGLGGNGFSGQGGSGFTLTQSNSMRMEPIL